MEKLKKKIMYKNSQNGCRIELQYFIKQNLTFHSMFAIMYLLFPYGYPCVVSQESLVVFDALWLTIHLSLQIEESSSKRSRAQII